MPKGLLDKIIKMGRCISPITNLLSEMSHFLPIETNLLWVANFRRQSLFADYANAPFSMGRGSFSRVLQEQLVHSLKQSQNTSAQALPFCRSFPGPAAAALVSWLGSSTLLWPFKFPNSQTIACSTFTQGLFPCISLLYGRLIGHVAFRRSFGGLCSRIGPVCCCD